MRPDILSIATHIVLLCLESRIQHRLLSMNKEEEEKKTQQRTTSVLLLNNQSIIRHSDADFSNQPIRIDSQILSSGIYLSSKEFRSRSLTVIFMIVIELL
jgi:hypothetical protein